MSTLTAAVITPANRPRTAQPGAKNPPALTKRNYAILIKALIRKQYRFVSFDQADDLLQSGHPFVLMRHDVDFDPVRALDLARIEHQHGVTSTYFLMVRTQHYNVFTPEISRIVHQILQLGHRLGLHFDCDAYPVDLGLAELTRNCAREACMLRQWFDTSVDIVSFHRPHPSILTKGQDISAPLPHTYRPRYTRDVTYLSDSRGIWRHGYPLTHTAFQQNKPLQILTHPVWWTDTPSSARDTLLAYERNKAAQLQLSIARNCKAYKDTTSNC